VTATMSGVRVLEVAEHTFVPAAGAVLAEWGADVIKIEHPERGDAMRGLASTGVINLGAGPVHALLEHSNRGKRSLALDLSSPEGVEIMHELARNVDVFLTNKMPSVRRKLRIDVDDIRACNPEIIYVRGSGFGARGSDADAGGYDALAFWARAGTALGAKVPEAENLPTMPAPAFGDSIGAMTIAGGISAALFHRQRTGEALVVDVSLLSTGLWAMGAAVALADQTGAVWGQAPSSGRPPTRNALAGAYRTQDDRWIALSCLQGFHYWPDARRVFGLEHLANDPRFADAASFSENSHQLAELIADVVAGAPQSEWRGRLQDFRGQWSPVQDALEVIDDPQVTANGYVLEARTSGDVPFRLVTTPVQFDGEPMPVVRAPDFNEHGDEILTGELGLAMEEVIKLKLKGVVA
jgi:crotonobetainyl-CoA:carnitine CoA-transferase CaiB-like acyl-CoA transferase